MQADFSAAGRPAIGLGLALAWLAAAATLAGCAAPQPVPAPAPAPAPMLTPAELPPPQLAPAPAAAEAAPAPAPARATLHPADAVLAYADRVRGLPPAELAQEIQRLGETSYSPLRALQLALALGQARNGGHAPRAQSLLQRVLQDPEGQPLHGLARLLAAQLAEQRRLEEQTERQAQQLRETQRRIDQLNERLEAVRAIERSLPTRPRRDPPLATPPPRTAAPRASAP
jgi:hypothetical protein